MNVSCKRAVDHNPIEQNGVELITVDLITVGQNLVDFFAVELNTECQFRIRSKYCRHRSCRTNSYLCITNSKHSYRPKSEEHLMRPLLVAVDRYGGESQEIEEATRRLEKRSF